MNIEKLFYSNNIAKDLNETQLDTIGVKVLNDYIQDKQSRHEWEERMAESLKITIQLAEKKNTPWPNASNVKFPLLSIASVQFSSRIFPQLFATPRPVKMRVSGMDPTSEKHNRAARISDHMSYQVLEQDEDWLSEHDKLLITLPIMGSAFIKTYFNRFPCGVHVSPWNLIINYYAKSLETASRYSHIIPMYRNEIIEKQRAGLFLDHEIMESKKEKSVFDTVQDQFQGAMEPANDEDAPLDFFEQYCWLDLDEDGYKEPYTVTFDSYGQVFRIVNRFAQISQEGKKILKITAKHYFTKYTFIPSPDGGFYDMGFGSLLTPVNVSINTLMNQLIDAGTLSNRPGGFLGRGARLKGGTLRFKMGEFIRVDATGDDIRRNIFPMPFHEPSHTLFNLMQYLVDYGERLSSVSDISVGKTPGQNTPATTSMAALEESQKVINAIYLRVYRALKKEFQARYLLNQEFLDPQEYFMIEDNPKAIFQQDYLGDPTDIQPTADPNLSSDIQRLTRLQAVMQRAQAMPGYNIAALERRFLELLNVEGMDEIYPLDQNGQPVIQPPPNPKLEIESTKFQADQLMRNKELQIKAALADSEIAMKETEALLNLAKAENLGNKDQIEAYKMLIFQLKETRGYIDGLKQRGVPAMENRPDHGENPKVPESVQPEAVTTT